MLSAHPRLNPAVSRAAELMSDRGMSDALLRDVAAMRGLPLLIEADAAPSHADLLGRAHDALGGAVANLHVSRRLFVAACRRIGMANQRPAAERRAAQSAAMRGMNKARAELVRAEKREAAARAARAALASLAH